MPNRTIKDWIIATRPWSFPASVMPVIVAIAYTFYIYGVSDTVNWGFGLLAIVGIILIHAGGNLISDFHDYNKGIDNKETVCVQTIVSGLFKPSEVLWYGLILLLIGSFIGLYLVVFHFGVKLLLIGLFGIGSAIGYYLFKFRALGDLLIFLAFGPMAMLGSGVVLTGDLDPMYMILSIPIGLITVSILHANNTLDIESDTKAGIKTFASILGVKWSVFYYKGLLGLAALIIIGLALVGKIPLYAIVSVLIVAPLMMNCQKTMGQAQQNISALVGLDESTAKLQMAFSVALSLALIIGPIIGLIKTLI